MDQQTHREHFVVKVNGKSVEFDERIVKARAILDRAGYEGQFCLAATKGESGKIDREFSDADDVDLHDYKHFRATFCGPEVVS